MLLPQSMVVAATKYAGVQAKQAMPSDPSLRRGVLANGLTYYVQSHGVPARRAVLRLVVAAGSLLEDDDQLGMAHMVEHLAFTSTTGFGRQGVEDYLRAIGAAFGPDVNAETGLGETVYKFDIPLTEEEAISGPVLAGNLDRGVELLGEIASRLEIKDPEVANERLVIEEEWRLRLGASQRMSENFFAETFPQQRHTLRRPIGTLESIRTCPLQRIRDFYTRWYRPGNMAVIIVGDFAEGSVDKLIQTVEQRFASIPASAAERPPTFKLEIARGAEPLQLVVSQDAEVERATAHLYIFTENEVDPSPQYQVHAALKHMSGMIFGQRCRCLARRGQTWPWSSLGLSFSPMETRTEALTVGGTLKHPEDAGVALQAAIHEWKRFQQRGVLAEELAYVKERIKSILFRSLERTIKANLLVDRYQDHFLTEGAVSLATERARLQTLWAAAEACSVDDMSLYLSNFTFNRKTAVHLRTPPVSAGHDTLRRELTEQVTMGQLGPWITVRNAALGTGGVDLVTVADNAAQIHIEPKPWSKLPEIKELTLQNGTRVILGEWKGSDAGQQILLTGEGLQGSASVGESDYCALYVAQSCLLKAVADVREDLELRNYVVTEDLGLTLLVQPYTREVEATCNAGRLEILLQMIKGFMELLPMQRESVEAVKKALAEQMRLQGNDPASAQSLRLQLLIGDPQPWHNRRPTPEEVLNTSYEAICEVSRRAFWDFSRFTFVLTGNLPATADLLQVLQRTLGSIQPDKALFESASSEGKWIPDARSPAAVLSSTFPQRSVFETMVKGTDPKAFVKIVHCGALLQEDPFGTLAGGVSTLLEERLMKRLRSELGRVYSVSCYADVSSRAVRAATVLLTISFSCDPVLAEENLSHAQEVVSKFLSEPPSTTEVDALVVQLKARHRRRVSGVADWLSEITRLVSFFAAYPDEGDVEEAARLRLVDTDEYVTTIITQEALHRAARALLSPSHVALLRVPLEPARVASL